VVIIGAAKDGVRPTQKGVPMKVSLFSVVTAGLLMTSVFAKDTLVTKNFSPDAKFVPGEIILALKNGKSAKSFFAKKGDVQMLREIPITNETFYLTTFSGKSDMSEVLEKLNADPDVDFAEPNFIYSIGIPETAPVINELLDAANPDDPRFGELWGLVNTGSNEPNGRGAGVVGADINALTAWDITKGSKEVKIAVIDTGIDYRHPDLKENIWTNESELNGKPGVDDDGNGYIDDIHGFDFANNDSDPMDGHGHGTHCSGTIGAVHNNRVGVAGVMGEVTLVAIKFLKDNGSGDSESAIKAIDYATKLNVDLMSNSWGGGSFSEALKRAIQAASDKGIIFTAAAGNASTNNDVSPHYPSNYDVPNVVSVAAVTAQDKIASFSCYGKKTVHVAAPGQNILSTIINNNYDVYSGTSMATPHVSGMLGLLLAKEGRIPHDLMRERAIKTSVPVAAMKNKTVSGGRMNAYNLLTDTRPDRDEPDPSLWRRIRLELPFESDHPYRDGVKVSRKIHVPGARYLRIVVSQYELEAGYDLVTVINSSNGEEVDKISGKGTDYVSGYATGDTMEVIFTSDVSVNKWGFNISSIEVIL
jgi:subtilisin family serine protease